MSYLAIAHFVGPRQASRWVRLHYFSECFELAPFWRDKGVEALLPDRQGGDRVPIAEVNGRSACAARPCTTACRWCVAIFAWNVASLKACPAASNAPRGKSG